MAWAIEIGEAAKKQLAALDRSVAQRVVAFLRDRISPIDDPRSVGQALKGSRLGELWRYRVGDYRMIASIEDEARRILVLRIAHRSKVYR